MDITIDLPDDLFKKFQAALILREEEESTVLIEMIKKYVSSLFSSSTTNTPAIRVVNQNAFEDTNKAIRRIPLWANRPTQMNHRIIQSYFVCESDGNANKTAMKRFFVDAGYGSEWQFENNLASMCTNDSNAHGKVFTVEDINVSLCEEVADVVMSFRSSFIAHKPEADREIAEKATTAANSETQKRAFISWFRTQTYNGRPYNPVTISGYSGRIENACQDAAFTHIQPKNLFQINNPSDFTQIKRNIQSCPGYAAFDAKSHNGFTAALNKYEEYLRAVSRLPFNATAMPAPTNGAHQWTAREDEICCRRFVERYVIGKGHMDVGRFAEQLHNELPNISVGSLRMKLQNIKCLCNKYHIQNFMDAKPLNQFSKQSETAFLKVLERYKLKSEY